MKKQQLEAVLGEGRVQEQKNISPYFTLRTQTVAQYYFEAETREDFKAVAALMAKKELPIFILGGGSNLAVTKPVIEGLVVRNLYQKKEIVAETPEYVDLTVTSGYPMARLALETARDGYEGLEYQSGLPGTVGGAIYMNSKWTNPVSYTGDSLFSATLIDAEGKEKLVEKEYFKFAYDYSVLQETHEVVLDATFRLKKNSAEVLTKRAQDAIAYRKETQPYGVPTGGCFFQNVGDDEKERLKLPSSSAGYLIDHAGLKNMKVGDFVVSDKHANFIINTGQGKPEDLRALLDTIKSRVKDQYGVTLKEEVIVI